MDDRMEAGATSKRDDDEKLQWDDHEDENMSRRRKQAEDSSTSPAVHAQIVQVFETEDLVLKIFDEVVSLDGRKGVRGRKSKWNDWTTMCCLNRRIHSILTNKTNLVQRVSKCILHDARRSKQFKTSVTEAQRNVRSLFSEYAVYQLLRCLQATHEASPDVDDPNLCVLIVPYEEFRHNPSRASTVCNILLDAMMSNALAMGNHDLCSYAETHRKGLMHSIKMVMDRVDNIDEEDDEGLSSESEDGDDDDDDAEDEDFVPLDETTPSSQVHDKEASELSEMEVEDHQMSDDDAANVDDFAADEGEEDLHDMPITLNVHHDPNVPGAVEYIDAVNVNISLMAGSPQKMAAASLRWTQELACSGSRKMVCSAR